MIATRSLLAGSALLLGLGMAPQASFAHSVQTDYYALDDRVEIQSTFSTGEVFEGAPVVVYAPNDPTTPWLETTTDENGEFVFEPDPTIAGEWSVEIGEGGHWDNLLVPVNEAGIEAETISEVPERPSERHRHIAGLTIAGASIAGGLGFRFLL
ncbi:hypothetical protein [Roseofilum casamattae]|uniref:Nickel transport protein n=1 Tax=Roseofilum casamattae BLCC-M143 TaxID=3022442 RepID=A0ABT7BUC6_9CYAN|nr:hypothetical protein [Roseofilum casamattae]MDJ1182690.1 hypothetical protein [Roseofilum casamattae BLCC-M143]